MKLVRALNEVHSNIWALVILGAAVTLLLKGKPDQGLLILAASLIKQTFASEKETDTPPQLSKP